MPSPTSVQAMLLASYDPGKQLLDPLAFKQLVDLLFSLGNVTGITGPGGPGPTLPYAYNIVQGPGSSRVTLPYALISKTVTLFNNTPSPLLVSAQSYNPNTGVPDVLAGQIPVIPPGTLATFMAYSASTWILTGQFSTTGAPPSDEGAEDATA